MLRRPTFAGTDVASATFAHMDAGTRHTKMLQRIILLEPEVGDGEHASHRRRRYRNRNWGSCFHGRQPPRHYHITVASTFFFAASDDNEAKRAREQIEVGHGTLS